MDAIELGVLTACEEVVRRQHEMLPGLAARLGVAEQQVWYTWKLQGCKALGHLEDEDWVYWLHGHTCELRNQRDGRFLRIDFGPRGSVDTFSDWGVLQFIMTSIHPWQEFPELRTLLAAKPPPYDPYSGSAQKMSMIWCRLEEKGVFEQADPSLVEFEARHRTIGPDGIARIEYPPSTPIEITIDCSVAFRQRLSPRGREILEQRLACGFALKPQA